MEHLRRNLPPRRLPSPRQQPRFHPSVTRKSAKRWRPCMLPAKILSMRRTILVDIVSRQCTQSMMIHQLEICLKYDKD